MQTLFLDRDGVINRRIIGGYVTNIDEFEFLPGVLNALTVLSKKFSHIFIVTNQQGVGKGLFSIHELYEIHQHMLDEIKKNGGKIANIYVSPHLEKENNINRKPNPGMALQAKQDFPEINFNTSIMVGDSLSDMQFGKKVGMKTVFLTNGESPTQEIIDIADLIFVDLLDFSANHKR